VTDNLTGLRRINGLKRWCIENYVPLKQFKRGEIHLAFYESFCERPESELAILPTCHIMGISYAIPIWPHMTGSNSRLRKDERIKNCESLWVMKSHTQLVDVPR
jgi:hypothetical protein